MDIKPLDQMEPGEHGRIVKIGLRGKLRLKLMDMGLIQDAVIEVLGIAPLGDPMEIKLKGFNLSLRKEDARLIMVSVEEKADQKDG
jgi:ferrous iron transport protein A